MKTMQYNNRTYVYSEIDDSWYPTPTESEYRFQMGVIIVGCIVVLAFAAYALLQP